MTISGSVDFAMARNDLVQEAMYSAGVLAVGEPASSDELFSAVRLLDMMVKAWSGSPNVAQRGVKVWARKRATLFLADGDDEYDLGPTGDHATRSYDSTTLASAAAAGAGSITVTDDAGMADGDVIGVMLDSGVWHWDVVSRTPAANVVTLTSTLAG